MVSYELGCYEFKTYRLMGIMIQAHDSRQRMFNGQSNVSIIVFLRFGGQIYMEYGMANSSREIALSVQDPFFAVNWAKTSKASNIELFQDSANRSCSLRIVEEIDVMLMQNQD